MRRRRSGSRVADPAVPYRLWTGCGATDSVQEPSEDEDDMLDRLTSAGVRAESLAALTIAPLVLVAWADGSIDTKEHEAIASAAEKAGIKAGTMAYQLLQGWLAEKPDESLSDTWTEYTKAMCEKLQAGDKIKLSEQVLGRCKSVAESAGGFLGLGSISAKEQTVLDGLASAFE